MVRLIAKQEKEAASPNVTIASPDLPQFTDEQWRRISLVLDFILSHPRCTASSPTESTIEAADVSDVRCTEEPPVYAQLSLL